VTVFIALLAWQLPDSLRGAAGNVSALLVALSYSFTQRIEPKFDTIPDVCSSHSWVSSSARPRVGALLHVDELQEGRPPR
jgi:hypothetical protein